MLPSSARLVSRLKMRHLALILNIAERESLTRVAEAMGISQPAATKALAEVESIFGGPLFTRTPRGLRLTPLGELAVVRARHMLQDVDSWALEMEAQRGGHAAHLNVGAVPFISARVLVPTIERLHQRHRITVTLERATTDQLLQSLRGHALDCVIGRASVMINMQELHHELLYAQRPALIANPRLARRMARRKPDWRELADMNWILPRPATPIGSMVSELFTRAGARPPSPMIETYSMDVITALMNNDDSLLSIVPEDIAADLSRIGSVTVVPWTFDWALPPISLIRRKREVPMEAEERFTEILREVCREIDDGM
ncbi:LysR family transcriptional regulator [Bordetella sp. H567]|uniref:LysR substrate-binding domain-containing protein n=1 Tax=Bordetella sp. H567 TaxID=1697043 RepID=UPI00081D01D7|nr:LysR substrate-binding domain-containing protein [Bordetella sp. H567]AOB31172.1 LysR family transcriptional regulator [Bordetella sp. H567]